jgi:hypothetical protein
LTAVHVANIGVPLWKLHQVIIQVAGRVWHATFDEWIGHLPTSRKLKLQGIIVIILEDRSVPFRKGRVLFGPVLKFRGKEGDKWKMSVTIGTEDVHSMPPLRFETATELPQWSNSPFR